MINKVPYLDFKVIAESQAVCHAVETYNKQKKNQGEEEHFEQEMCTPGMERTFVTPYLTLTGTQRLSIVTVPVSSDEEDDGMDVARKPNTGKTLAARRLSQFRIVHEPRPTFDRDHHTTPTNRLPCDIPTIARLQRSRMRRWLQPLQAWTWREDGGVLG